MDRIKRCKHDIAKCLLNGSLRIQGTFGYNITQRVMGLDEILELEFKGDKHRSGTIRNWIEGTCDDPNSESVREQLQSYIMGPTVQSEIADKNFRALVSGYCWIAPDTRA